MKDGRILSEIEDLADDIQQSWPEARVEFEAFPSGSGMLDVFRDDRHYIFTYSTSYKLYSVDEVGKDEPPFINYYRYNYPDFASAAERFRKLVSGQEPPVHPEGSWREVHRD